MARAPRRLRADATRNRALILAAAREAFVEDGLNVSMAEIARRAGVGFATAQRRFPTKADLVREIVADELAELRNTATNPDAATHPGEAFTEAIRACAAHQATQPGLAGAIADAVSEAAHTDATGGISSIFAAVTQHAPDSGVLSPDITLDDVLAILYANAGVIAHSPGSEHTASARFVEVALRGIRAAPGQNVTPLAAPS
ncbi:TetR/AcrR family transcriptional regulator [Microbacterium sp. NPDC087592]|uniref:TetR/AcrR family transcriptional regulator n=1 Tax=Microbacterium sp. NPDC087592 TaxID=3364193 RepID=UPI00380A6E59